jgi:hypothetical protein
MTTEPTQRGSEGEIETAAETLWLSFCARMGGEWSGRDGSLASKLCWVTAEKILRDAIRRPASPVGVSEEQVDAALKVWSASAWASIQAHADGNTPKDGPREAMRAALQAVIAAVPTPDGATP